MRPFPFLTAFVLAAPLAAQGTPGRFPPDSLVNTQVIPRGTPVREVLNTMRGFSGALGVRCNFCHVGQEGASLATYDFGSDRKGTKQIARQMMRMVAEVNRRLDTLPGHAADDPRVTCRTCHRGVSLPEPLGDIVTAAAAEAGADSALRAYRALRARYYGRDAYDFGEPTLVGAALGLARDGRTTEALAVLALNEEYYPASAGTASARGTIQLQRGDTAAAVGAYREALRRDPDDREARGRLRELGQTP
ncbi:MAG TPA: c-type cytochrome [Gemmatimonadales bacterium]|nr:c-type cytochrome [Gemmatimonadales bacterium]